MHSLPLIKHSNHPSAASTSRETNITVRFELSEFDTVAQVYPELTTIGEVLDDVASKFQLMPKYLSIKHKFGSKIPKPARLIQLCTNNFRILDVQLCLSDLANHLNESIHNEHEKIHIDTNSYYRENLLPDFISVTIPDKDDMLNSKCITVEIINIPIIKPFLGGYVNKITGIVYHNAYTQTGPMKEQIKYSGLVTRDTQTTGLNSISKNNTTASQKEQKSDETLEIENRCAVIIQRNFRSFLWRKFFHNLLIDGRSQNEDKKVKEECLVDIHPNAVLIGSPRTRSDFKALKSKIHAWKEGKVQYIKQNFNDKDRQQSEFHNLLEEEVRLLNEIEKKRNKIRKEIHEKYMDKMLDKMGAPVKWIGYKNIQCEMDLLICQKIRRLTTLYHQLKTPGNKIERLEFVGELYIVLAEEQHTIFLEELLDLLRREQKMLLASIDKETISSLRRRQNELFRNFIVSQKVFKPLNKSSL